MLLSVRCVFRAECMFRLWLLCELSAGLVWIQINFSFHHRSAMCIPNPSEAGLIKRKTCVLNTRRDLRNRREIVFPAGIPPKMRREEILTILSTCILFVRLVFHLPHEVWACTSSSTKSSNHLCMLVTISDGANSKLQYVCSYWANTRTRNGSNASLECWSVLT